MNALKQLKLGLVTLASTGIIAACGGSSGGSSSGSVSVQNTSTCPVGLGLVLKKQLTKEAEQRLAAGASTTSNGVDVLKRISKPYKFDENHALYQETIGKDSKKLYRAVAAVEIDTYDDSGNAMKTNAMGFVYVDSEGKVSENIPLFVPFSNYDVDKEGEVTEAVVPVFRWNAYNSNTDSIMNGDQVSTIQKYYGDLFIDWIVYKKKYESIWKLFEEEDLDDSIADTRVDSLIPSDFRADVVKVRAVAEKWTIAGNYLLGEIGFELKDSADETLEGTLLEDSFGDFAEAVDFSDEIDEILSMVDIFESLVTGLQDGVLDLRDLGVNDACLKLVIDNVDLDGDVGAAISKLDLRDNAITISGLRNVLRHLDMRDKDGNRIHGLGIGSIDISGNNINNTELDDAKKEFEGLLEGVIFTHIKIIMNMTVKEASEIIDEYEDEDEDEEDEDDEE